MKENKTYLIIHNLLMSKYIYNSIIDFPKIINLHFNIILYYKQKQKYFLFINMILLLLFFNPNIKTRFFFKISSINVLQLNLRGQNSILKFIHNFIYIYFPLIDCAPI